MRKFFFIFHTFIIYFLLSAFIVTCSFLIFFSSGIPVIENLRPAAIYTFFNVLFITAILVGFDLIRRRITVERPVKKIQDALSKITAGDFSVRLDTAASRAEYTEIMQSINRMTEELGGVETLRSDFIANVSHEMKTPLAVMQNYGTLLQAPDLSESERLEYAKAITDSSERLASLMTNILKLNKLENQQIYPEPMEYNLGEQLCECLLLFEDIWEKNEIRLETDIAENVFITADSELLALVWNNLLSNAFKFTPRGGKISVVLTCNENTAIVKVKDTGCGMTPEVGAHIFEKFYQGDASRATQGNGLGLALVRRITDIVRGEISVESEPGRGSIFTVNIPRQ
ncbi:MAG: HAMP domain-containing histidine kinase [Oscillospiraceae bacterium]|nr:HAMP domain-containing histidine kinase [Oscillospiraceae bacterium]